MSLDLSRILTSNRLRVYPVLFFCLFYSLWLFWICTGSASVDRHGTIIGSDFLTMYSGSVFANSTDPWMAYNLESFQQIQDKIAGVSVKPLLWIYPPTAFLIVWPMVWLPYLIAWLAWMFLTSIFFLAVLKKITPGRHILWIVVSSAGFYLNWIQGQNAFFTGSLLGWGFLLLDKRPFLAGCVWSFLSYKPQMAVPVFLFLLSTKRWKPFLAMCGSVGCLMFVSIIFFGLQSWQSFWDCLSITMGHVNEQHFPIYKMVTPYAAAILGGSTLGQARIFQVAWTTSCMLWIFYLWKKRANTFEQLVLTTIAIFFLTPYAWDYEISLLLIPGAWIVDRALKNGWRKNELALLFLLYLAPMILPPLAAITKIQLTFLLPLIALYIVAKRMRSDAERTFIITK
jgi:hypothetical protein